MFHVFRRQVTKWRAEGLVSGETDGIADWQVNEFVGDGKRYDIMAFRCLPIVCYF